MGFLYWWWRDIKREWKILMYKRRPTKYKRRWTDVPKK
jgi:hypothetical protein